MVGANGRLPDGSLAGLPYIYEYVVYVGFLTIAGYYVQNE